MKLIDLCSYTKYQSFNDVGYCPFIKAKELSVQEIINEAKNE